MLPTSGPKTKVRKKKDKTGATSLTKEKIISTAINLIDENGVESFSMRNLAKALEVYPTAIYWHIPGINALMGEIVAEILRDLPPPYHHGNWKLWIRELFERYRYQIRQHPNVAPLVGIQLVSNASIDFDMIERIILVLSDAGFSDIKIPAAFNVVIGAMVGYTTQEFALVPSSGKEEWQDSMQQTIKSVNATKYPNTARLINSMCNNTFILRWDNGIDAPLDDGFNMFVDSVVYGLDQLPKN
jgi:AcrR family transcriptional regulator